MMSQCSLNRVVLYPAGCLKCFRQMLVGTYSSSYTRIYDCNNRFTSRGNLTQYYKLNLNHSRPPSQHMGHRYQHYLIRLSKYKKRNISKEQANREIDENNQIISRAISI